MKTSDKWLIGIVVGALLLVCIAFIVALRRPQETYQSDSTPVGVTHNYLLALKKNDYARAYGYLSPSLPGYPATLSAFTTDITTNRYTFNFDGVTLKTGEVRPVGPDRMVTVQKSAFYGRGLFESRQSNETFTVTLRQERGAWKVTHADQYWAYDWSEKPPLPRKAGTN